MFEVLCLLWFYGVRVTIAGGITVSNYNYYKVIVLFHIVLDLFKQWRGLDEPCDPLAYAPEQFLEQHSVYIILFKMTKRVAYLMMSQTNTVFMHEMNCINEPKKYLHNNLLSTTKTLFKTNNGKLSNGIILS